MNSGHDKNGERQKEDVRKDFAIFSFDRGERVMLCQCNRCFYGIFKIPDFLFNGKRINQITDYTYGFISTSGNIQTN